MGWLSIPVIATSLASHMATAVIGMSLVMAGSRWVIGYSWQAGRWLVVTMLAVNTVVKVNGPRRHRPRRHWVIVNTSSITSYWVNTAAAVIVVAGQPRLRCHVIAGLGCWLLGCHCYVGHWVIGVIATMAGWLAVIGCWPLPLVAIGG